MRKSWDTSLLEPGSLSLNVFYVIGANMFVFFLLSIFFNGGAFPYGEVVGEKFLIADNAGTRHVSKSWFWFTFWQGFIAWGGIGLFFACGATWDLFQSFRAGASGRALVHVAVLILSLIWLFFVGMHALEILGAELL